MFDESILEPLVGSEDLSVVVDEDEIIVDSTVATENVVTHTEPVSTQAPPKPNPNSIQHLRLRTPNTAFMYFTRKVVGDSVLHTCKINGPIQHNVLYSDLITILQAMGTKDKMHLYIESGGGSIRIGTVIMDAIRACRGHVTTISVGCIASMAAGIWSCGDKMVSLPHSDVMYHMSLHGAYGNSINILKQAATTVTVVNEALVKYFYNRGLITIEERDQMQTSNDAVWIPYMDMNERLRKLDLLSTEVCDVTG